VNAMKTKILLVLLILFLTEFSLYAGWTDKGKYLEMQDTTGSIQFIKFSNDGTKLFTVNRATYKIWDTKSGSLIKQFTCPIYQTYQTIPFNSNFISADDSTIVFAYGDVCAYDTYCIHYLVYRISDDSVLFKLSNKIGNLINGMYHVLFENFKTNFDYSSETMLYAEWATFVKGSGLEYNYYSSLNFTDFKTDTPKKSVICYPVIGFDNYSNKNVSAYLNTLETSDVNHSFSVIYSFLNLLDLSTLKSALLSKSVWDSRKNIPYDPVNDIKVVRDSNLVAEYLQSKKVILWNTDSLKASDSCIIPDTPMDFQFSYNGKTIVAGFSSGIYLLRFPSMKAVDSIPFPGGIYYNWKIAISPDSNSFAFGSYNGMIRLVKTDWFTKVDSPESNVRCEFANQTFSISPNPATDFLEISYSHSINHWVNPMVDYQDVVIYNVFGVKIPPRLTSSATPQEGNLRLDVSSLSPGVYFVKVGEKVGKFIKIDK